MGSRKLAKPFRARLAAVASNRMSLFSLDHPPAPLPGVKARPQGGEEQASPPVPVPGSRLSHPNLFLLSRAIPILSSERFARRISRRQLCHPLLNSTPYVFHPFFSIFVTAAQRPPLLYRSAAFPSQQTARQPFDSSFLFLTFHSTIPFL